MCARRALTLPFGSFTSARMTQQEYLVVLDHVSEFPEPLTFSKGAVLSVGERYEGPEDWNDWYSCTTPGQQPGWVPSSVLEFLDDGRARALEDYTARELDVHIGETVLGSRVLQGWVWCQRPDASASGWVPLANLTKKNSP